MNSKFYVLVCLVLTLLACNKDSSEVSPTHQNTYVAPHAAAKDSSETDNSLFIPVSDANKMISSYLASIDNSTSGSANASSTMPDIKSFSIDADSLRAYLSDPTIKSVKLMFAHTMDYINAGHEGEFAGMQAGAITIIIAAYKENGDYVYHNGSYVLDHCAPCPYICPVGAAGSGLLQQ